MKFINKENGDEFVEVTGHHKDYATKGLAGTALGFGIAGTVGALLNGGANLLGGAPRCGGGPSAGAWIGDTKAELYNGMWELAYNGAQARRADRELVVAELFGLYKSQVDADFQNYKFSRDSYDAVSARIGNLETQIAVLAAIKPYENKIIKCELEKVADHAAFNLATRTCRMIKGEVVLPSTPTVTGFQSASSCNCGQTTVAGE